MTDVDIAVLGGGIIGCLIARELACRAGDLTITVIDRELVGGGASRRSAGVHFPRGATARVREMTEFSHHYYEQLLRDTPSLPIFPLAMSLVAREAEDSTGSYLPSAQLTRATGVPGLDLPAGVGVWTGKGCQYADVHALTVALAGELRPRVKIREGIAVSAVLPGPNAVELRLSNGESLSARRVVLAPGPWVGARPWRELVAPLGIRVKQVVALHVDRVPVTGDRLIVFQDADAFLLPVRHRGHWLFSYTSRRWDVNPEEPAVLDEATLAEGRAELARLVPPLAERIVAGRVFCDAYSPNREPLIQRLDTHGRLVFAGAANGSGYRLAPAIAAKTAELLGIESEQRISA
ncbi:NAD(P)/FAD-dependent oxidoreductase [Nocardia sp. NPDC088792]|uniref:NAD(P)/FAD-dependent oxidoreductase n=1 Tax=Nocardia sp. NPDC088792 TaxID=3364332 RepID=UPI0038161B57